MALFSRLVPTFFVNVLAVHGRNICTLLFTISILGTHRLLYKITLPNCLSGAHTLSHSITHLLHTRLALSDQLLGTHSFIVGGAHFFRYRVTLTLILSLALSVIFCFTFLISNSVALFLLLSFCDRLGHLLALHGRCVVALLFHHHIAHVLGHSLLLGFHLCLTFLLLLSVAFFIIFSMADFFILVLAHHLWHRVRLLYLFKITLLLRFFMALLFLHSITLFTVDIFNLIFIFSLTLFFMMSDTMCIMYSHCVRFLFSFTLLPRLVPTFSFIYSLALLGYTAVGVSH